MKQKENIDELFPNGVNIDINHERSSINFQNLNNEILSDTKFLNNVAELFNIILNSLFIEKYIFMEIFLTDILEENISYDSKLLKLKSINDNIFGIGNEYRYRDENFEI
ncbi:hypothetical protein [Macrococcus armenti]|uniref:hypothetical protein n=1 Tax=Macrococcus armenti TaxID=2875764 RepID=UPI001CCE4AC5|nr:hypothetical protein [Macrococcus armenti]UBH16133.1 hypothetical protein LAU44_04065 [Macrococcus armenti]UBH18493.1 hypothetical protein LAU39_04075 [Macrococcus armenti]UBH20760.1 hypothetical protein LAU40_04065 [Macrococcus armenti]